MVEIWGGWMRGSLLLEFRRTRSLLFFLLCGFRFIVSEVWNSYGSSISVVAVFWIGVFVLFLSCFLKFVNCFVVVFVFELISTIL